MLSALTLAADAGSLDVAATAAQYGILGLVALGLFLFAKGAIQREREQRDQAQQQVDKLNEFIRTEMLPRQIETGVLYKQVSEALEQAIGIITEFNLRDKFDRERRTDLGGGSHG